MLVKHVFYCALINMSGQSNSGKRTHKALTMQEKATVIKQIEDGAWQTDICRSKINHKTTTSTIMKIKEKIWEAAAKFKNVKKLHQPVRNTTDNALFEWFKHQRSINTPISGFLLRLHRFKKGYDVNLAKIHGESASVNLETVSGLLKLNGFTGIMLLMSIATCWPVTFQLMKIHCILIKVSRNVILKKYVRHLVCYVKLVHLHNFIQLL